MNLKLKGTLSVNSPVEVTYYKNLLVEWTWFVYWAYVWPASKIYTQEVGVTYLPHSPKYLDSPASNLRGTN